MITKMDMMPLVADVASGSKTETWDYEGAAEVPKVSEAELKAIAAAKTARRRKRLRLARADRAIAKGLMHKMGHNTRKCKRCAALRQAIMRGQGHCPKARK